MSLAWKIEFQETAIKQLKKMGRNDSARIRDFLHKRVKSLDDPRQLGEALQGPRFEHLWRYRVGDYRIICEYMTRNSWYWWSTSGTAEKFIDNS